MENTMAQEIKEMGNAIVRLETKQDTTTEVLNEVRTTLKEIQPILHEVKSIPKMKTRINKVEKWQDNFSGKWYVICFIFGVAISGGVSYLIRHFS